MDVGLFTRHDQSSTAAYLRAAIDNAGDRVTPLYGTDIATADLDALLFVEPPPDCWPVGLEDLRCPTAVYLIDTHQDLGLRLTYAPFFDEIFVAQLNKVSIVEVRALGRFGRLFISGTESDVQAAARAATEALAELEGKS